jgi:O-methyltransferase
VLDYLDWSSVPSAVESIRRRWLFQRVHGYTLVSHERLNALCNIIRTLERDRIDGAIVECGVYRGGASALMAHEARGRRDVVLFDSFEGLPPPGDRDGNLARTQYEPGWCAGSEQDVRKIFQRLGCLTPKVRLVKGWFDKTFPHTTIDRIAILHVDADWYESVRVCLETWFDRIVPGGFLVLDDYGRWPGCTQAVDEFLAARGLPPLEPTGNAGHFLRRR